MTFATSAHEPVLSTEAELMELMHPEATVPYHPRCRGPRDAALVVTVLCLMLAATAAIRSLGESASVRGAPELHSMSALELKGVLATDPEFYCCGGDGMGAEKIIFTIQNNGSFKEGHENCKTVCEKNSSCGYWEYGFMASGCVGISKDETCFHASSEKCQSLNTKGKRHPLYSKVTKEPSGTAGAALERYCCGKKGMGANRNVFTFPNKGNFKEEVEICKNECETNLSCGYWQYGFMAGGCEGISKDETCYLVSSKQCQSLNAKGMKHRLYYKAVKPGVSMALRPVSLFTSGGRDSAKFK